MNTKKDSVTGQCRRFFIMLCVIIGIIFCVVLIFNIKNNRIITLSAISNSTQQVNQPNASSTQSPTPESAPVIQMQADSSVNIVTEAAVKLGVLSCVSRINQVATFLTANNQTGVFIFKPQNQPDQHIFSTSFELVRKDNSTLYASASFFPNQDAVYDTVEYVNKSCEELEKTTFKNLKRVSVMKKNIILLDGGKVKVFLMPAGSGTVVIKKEVIQ
ncbi:MAG: hypothetical protein JW787_02560 [Sedimentisphaerales bacterium]|nr:hypothetical protein [Sedimentisphaerales bacterium]